MIRRALLCLAGFSFVTLAGARVCPPVAQPPSAQQVVAAQAAARDRGFLWRIEQGGRVSWLYGTVHVGKLDWVFPGPTVAQAFKAARVIALELDPTDADAMRAALATFGTEGAGRAAPLPAPLQQRLARRIEAECLPAAAMAALAPVMQVMTLASMVARRDGLDPAFGIDTTLAGLAHGAGKPVIALESFEQQRAALTAGQPEEERRFVEQMLDEIDSDRGRSQALRLARAWAEGDFAPLESYPRWCECLDTPEDRAQMRRLLDDRNVWMAGRIDALHREGGGVFAAVGSLHMIGAQGLPALLAARGYRVERVLFGPAAR